MWWKIHSKNKDFLGIGALIQLRDGNVLIGNYESLFFVYDIKNNTISEIDKNVDESGIYCLLSINDHLFASGSYCKGDIDIWEY